MSRTVLLALFFALPALAATPDWVRDAIPTNLPESTKHAKAVVLLDERVMTVVGRDIYTRHRRVVRIQSNAGRDYGWAAVYFDNDTKLKSLRAWSLDARGNQYEVKERDAVETSPFDFELFSDARVKMLRIPAADPGSVVAYESEQRERPYLLQTLWRFQEEIPVLVARLQLVVADNWSHEIRWSNYEPVEPANGGYEVRDVPAIADEPRMPAASALAGRAALTFRAPGTAAARGWDDVALWFGGLASGRFSPTPEIRDKARELATIRALARFAQRDVRYVAIEIGIGGYQPHAAGQVFRNRYGDCKDKATLLKSMLKEIGIESHYVLVNTTRGVVDPALPALGAFNHVILAIAAPEKTHASIEHPKLGKLILFDPTSTTTPFGHLPDALQDSRGLLVTADGGELIALPPHAADANQLRRKASLALDASGTLAGEVEEVRTGRIASEMRLALQPLSARERARYMETVLAAHLTNYTASGLAIENLDDADRDLVIRYGITSNGYARRVADMLLVRPRVLGQKPEAIVDMSTRTHGYVTDGPSLQTDEIEIAVAPPLQIDELPPAVTMSTAAVQYDSRSEFKDGVLRYKRKYALSTYFVPRESLPELNRAFTKILADERASAVFK